MQVELGGKDRQLSSVIKKFQTQRSLQPRKLFVFENFGSPRVKMSSCTATINTSDVRNGIGRGSGRAPRLIGAL